jgi:hypothetical protein
MGAILLFPSSKVGTVIYTEPPYMVVLRLRELIIQAMELSSLLIQALVLKQLFTLLREAQTEAFLLNL